jgi:hypothetical protein
LRFKIDKRGGGWRYCQPLVAANSIHYIVLVKYVCPASFYTMAGRWCGTALQRFYGIRRSLQKSPPHYTLAVPVLTGGFRTRLADARVVNPAVRL